MKRALRHIPFIEEVAAAYYAMLDPTTPLSARLTLVGALAYFVAPFDFVPDFIFAIGFLDDASILLGGNYRGPELHQGGAPGGRAAGAGRESRAFRQAGLSHSLAQILGRIRAGTRGQAPGGRLR